MLRIAWLPILAACGATPAPTPVPNGAAPKPAPVGEVAATELANVGYLPRCLALDGTHVYWTHTTDLDGSVWRVPKTGGTPEQLATEVPTPGTCIVVGNELWLSSHGKLVAMPTIGGSLRPVTDIVGELARGPDGIYIANRVAGLYRIAPGGMKTTITVRPVVSIVGGDVIVFATEIKDEPIAYDYRVWRLDADLPVELARFSSPPVHLARSTDTVFVATVGDDGMSELHAVPLSGGPAHLFAKHPHELTEMFVGDGYLWWGVSDGIMRMSLATKALSLHAADPSGRRSMVSRERLVADAEAVYWLSIDRRRWKSSTRAAIMRAPRQSPPP